MIPGRRINWRKIMRERNMTGDDERPNPETSTANHGDSAGVEPAAQRRRPRSKTSNAGRTADDFNPTSRGDERGEVM
jgi:hypothetical protein